MTYDTIVFIRADSTLKPYVVPEIGHDIVAWNGTGSMWEWFDENFFTLGD